VDCEEVDVLVADRGALAKFCGGIIATGVLALLLEVTAVLVFCDGEMTPAFWVLGAETILVDAFPTGTTFVADAADGITVVPFSATE
jgi:hypothetical protein